MANLLRTSLLKSIRPIYTLTKTPFIAKTLTVTPTIRIAPTRLNFSLPISRGFTATGLRLNAVPPAPKDAPVNKTLAATIEEELKSEKENKPKVEPEFIKTFLEQNPFKIDDKPGVNEVALTRTFGNEKITVLFDISSLTQQEPLSLSDDNDDRFSDDEDDQEETDDDEDEGIVQSPIECTVTIEKTGKGALLFELVLADSVFLINSVIYYRDASLANDWTAEADWKRRGFYPGPRFDTLDNNVQVLFEKYLEERGINTAVAMFIPNYIEHKEQKEYMSWLENVKNFIGSP